MNWKAVFFLISSSAKSKTGPAALNGAAFLACCFLMIAGCASPRFYFRSNPEGRWEHNDVRKFTSYYFLWSFLPAEHIYTTTELCPEGELIWIQKKQQAWVSILTLGLVTPVQIEAGCYFYYIEK